MRTAAKRDANERSIIEALKDRGAAVCQLNEPGLPDLLVGFRGLTILIEVKAAKAKLNDEQRAWHKAWTGDDVLIVRGAKDVHAFLDWLIVHWDFAGESTSVYLSQMAGGGPHNESA